jgi:DUF4097 and DUF4098 domain-containing protein YvlB
MRTLALAAATSALLFVGSPDTHRTIEQHYATTTTQRIELTGFSGAQLTVRCWEKNEVSIKLDISYTSSSKKDEQQYLDAVALRENRSQGELRVDYYEPEMANHGGRSIWSGLKSLFTGAYQSKEIRGEILVPSSNALTIDARYGTLSLDGVKGPLRLLGTGNTVTIINCISVGDVKNEYGKVTVKNCAGALRLESKSTTVIVEQFAGSAVIDAEYSNINVRDVSRSLSIHSSSGTITVDKVGEDATIRSPYTYVTATNIGGMLEVEDQSGTVKARVMDGVKIANEYGTIEISDVAGKAGKPIILGGQSGTISVKNAKGNVQIRNPYGPVTLKDIKGNVDLQSKSNQVNAVRISGDWSSTTEYCTVSVEELSAKTVTMTNTGGPIEISLQSIPTTVDIKNEYAKVDVEMPKGFSGEVDLNVTYGNIKTNLELSKRKSFDAGGGYAIGKIGNGNGKLSVETKSGELRVMQR